MRRSTAAALAAIGIGYAAERVLLRRERRRDDPAAGDDFRLPDAVTHRTLAMDDGGSMHVVEHGAGRPLVLLHGVTLTNEIWRYQLDDLAREFRVIAADHRGHGQSRAGEGGYAMERLAADVAAALVELDIRDAIVVGHSMGGMVLQRFALDFADVAAERVAGLVLLSTTARAAPQLAVAPVIAKGMVPVGRRGLRWSARMPGGMLPANDLSYLLMRIGFGQRPSPTHIEVTRAMEASMSPSVLGDLLGELLTFDAADELGRIDRPTLVVVGDHDRVTPLRHSKLIAARIPGAELAVLPGCGHMAMLERRAEVAALLRAFSDRVPSLAAPSGRREAGR